MTEVRVRVMGVDPGLTRCGIALVESGRGRTVTARNAEARAAYQRDLEAHRASVGGQTAV